MFPYFFVHRSNFQPHGVLPNSMVFIFLLNIFWLNSGYNSKLFLFISAATPSPSMATPTIVTPRAPLPRPVLPKERSFIEGVLEYVVGDGPQNRHALICKQCFGHNGMAFEEESGYLGQHWYNSSSSSLCCNIYVTYIKMQYPVWHFSSKILKLWLLKYMKKRGIILGFQSVDS